MYILYIPATLKTSNLKVLKQSTNFNQDSNARFWDWKNWTSSKKKKQFNVPSLFLFRKFWLPWLFQRPWCCPEP